MRPAYQFQLVHWLLDAGLNDCHISRITGISRGTIRDWRHQGSLWRMQRAIPGTRSVRQKRSDADCPRCAGADLEEPKYAYLLGMYLGDGCLSEHERGVFALRIACCDQYPGIMEACASAISAMRPNKQVSVFRTKGIGCTEVASLWKHWRCLFPQHGPGRKHERKIELEPWQSRLIARHPEPLLRGLIHSDGWRGMNRVQKRKYSYSRYQFSNTSDDIREIFCRACDLLGIRWRRMTWNTISVARRPDVERLDEFIGPKR